MSDNAHAVATEDIPWVPLRAGLSMRPLHFEENGYALQLRLEPGTVIAPHRHTGITHALNLSGYREILESGEIIGPGDFIFEPIGNTDSWRCHGDAPCIIQLSLTGRVEYLGPDGEVESYSDSDTAREAYLAYCQKQGVQPNTRIVGAH
ncbi:cupin domain-containing protein [Caulobacter sp.]|uniref:cupin domain-containing protein n=1 Tax=Caulobacter sp. TaxID=78 RepID=UPI003BABC6DA